MEICVCGWYFRKPFLDILRQVDESYPVSIVANRDEIPEEYLGDFYYIPRVNTGLEYGAYDYFLKREWSGGDVLFMHDDMTIQPIVRDFELVHPRIIFKTIEGIDADLVYIFKSHADIKTNFGIHGRVMKASGRFLERLLSHNDGFPVDEDNDGYTMGPQPDHCKHVNWAVAKLKEFWEPLLLDGFTVDRVVIPAIDYEIRGDIVTA